MKTQVSSLVLWMIIAISPAYAITCTPSVATCCQTQTDIVKYAVSATITVDGNLYAATYTAISHSYNPNPPQPCCPKFTCGSSYYTYTGKLEFAVTVPDDWKTAYEQCYWVNRACPCKNQSQKGAS